MASAALPLSYARDNFNDALSYALDAVRKKEFKLKEEQEQAIRRIFERHDMFLWLPTGFGKSLL